MISLYHYIQLLEMDMISLYSIAGNSKFSALSEPWAVDGDASVRAPRAPARFSRRSLMRASHGRVVLSDGYH
jgi:hypothetical protein